MDRRFSEMDRMGIDSPRHQRPSASFSASSSPNDARIVKMQREDRLSRLSGSVCRPRQHPLQRPDLAIELGAVRQLDMRGHRRRNVPGELSGKRILSGREIEICRPSSRSPAGLRRRAGSADTPGRSAATSDSARRRSRWRT
jgi:hypothetical protein